MPLGINQCTVHYRCDDSDHEVNLELCLENYVDSHIGCHSPFKSSTENSTMPWCDISQMSSWTKEFKIIEGLGEQAIYDRTGCLST